MISECGWAIVRPASLPALSMSCPVHSTLQCGSSVRAKIHYFVPNWTSFVINMPALSNNYQLFLVYAIHEMYSMSHNSLFPTFHNQNSLIQALFKPSMKTMPNQPTANYTSSYNIVCSHFFSWLVHSAPKVTRLSLDDPQLSMFRYNIENKQLGGGCVHALYGQSLNMPALSNEKSSIYNLRYPWTTACLTIA